MAFQVTQSLTSSRLGLRQFRAGGCLTYLLWDRASSQAVVVDPALGSLDDLRTELLENSLRLAKIIDTHTHADHLSVSHRLAAETGAGVAMGRNTQSLRPGQLLATGDSIRFGELQLAVIETPGHTPDSICLRFEDSSRDLDLLFTGDTLLIGATGRTDFPQADPAMLFESLRLIEKTCTSKTRILPGHDYSDLLFSLLSVEAEKNAQFAEKNPSNFIKTKTEEALDSNRDLIRRVVESNLKLDPHELPELGVGSATACGSALPHVDKVPSINVEKLSAKMQGTAAPGMLFIDVREPSEHDAGCIPGTENIPLSEIVLQWPHLAASVKVYLSCHSGRRSLMVARTLDRLGLGGVVNVSGGFQAWEKAGLPVRRKTV